jgi:hypothetical protein
MTSQVFVSWPDDETACSLADPEVKTRLTIAAPGIRVPSSKRDDPLTGARGDAAQWKTSAADGVD